jgi:multiple antibiotic resistance protein
LDAPGDRLSCNRGVQAMIGGVPVAAYVVEIAKSSILIASGLFPIVNPLGNSPIFLGLTRDYSSDARTLLSQKIALNGFFLLIASILTGTHILAFFGISVPVVQVGGGLLVISTAWAMLNRKEESGAHSKRTHQELSVQDISRRAFYPLTLPLTVGPGSISVAITLGANARHHFGADVADVISAILGSALIALSIYFSYRFAERIAQLLGETAMSVILRLSSFILLCIGVQIVWNGIASLLRTIPAR